MIWTRMRTTNPIIPNPKTMVIDPNVTFAIFDANPIPKL